MVAALALALREPFFVVLLAGATGLLLPATWAAGRGLAVLAVLPG